MTKIAPITGQDDANLAEFLLKKGSIVHAVKRRSSLFNADRIDHQYQNPYVDNRKYILHHGDMIGLSSLFRVSSINANQQRAYLDQDELVVAFLGVLNADTRKRLAGCTASDSK
jgi:GDP-D-mannose dehydratase